MIPEAGVVLARSARTRYVAFRGQEVVVASAAPEVLAALESAFVEMIVPESRCPVGYLEVCRDDRGYRISGHTEIALEDGSLADVIRCLRFSVVQLLIQARPDLLWLHAGAVTRSDVAVLFPGPRGRGKSTLVTGLCARGWAYLSDDVVPLDLPSGAVLPFPQTPARRDHPGREMPDDWLRAPSKIEVALTPSGVCREPVPVVAVVFPAYIAGAAVELAACSPATAAAELLRQSWNLADHGETAIRHVCDLVRRWSAAQLSFGDGDAAADYLDRRATGRPAD